MRKTLLCGALGAVCLSLPVGALADGIPEIVITPTRFAQPLAHVVVPTLVISRVEIKNSGAQTVAGVLRAYAGFDVTRLGGAGQQTSVFVQGTNSNMVRVLVNGVPINNATDGGVAWSTLPLTDIERIEVVKGPLSTVWGSGAMGGVVNIITRQPTGSGGYLSLGAGNHDTRRGALGLHASAGATHAGITLSGERTAGEPVVQGYAPRAAYHNRNLNAYADTQLGRLTVDARFWQNRGRQEYVTGGPPYSAYSLDAQNYLTQTSSLRFSLPLAARWLASARVEQTRNTLNQDQLDTYAVPPANDYARSTRDAVEAQLGYAAANTQVLLGVSGAHTHASSLSYGTTYNDRRTTRAGFVEWHRQFAGVALTAAGRRTVDSQYGGHDTWNLGISVPLPGAMRFKLSSGTGYRAPSFNALYGYGANPNLKPETSRSTQAQLLVPVVAGHGLLTLTAFQNRLRNLISTELVDPSTYTYQNVNIGNARIRGLDLSGTWQAGDWRLGASAGWQDPRNLDTGKRLLRRASHHYRLRVAWQHAAWNAAAVWTYTGTRAGVYERLPAYRLLNLSVGYRFAPQWSTRLRVDNALNTRYIPAYYGQNTPYLSPGRTVNLDLRYAFGAA
ncbi:TonB-dependent receptor plug domain-containing protein [Acidihalobacter ferrooxydans]|uniref:TonB-dependent receptor n=1 Tax=Acidihalobacter ferrooxydans TaxID=1765967 RepID=A0A1P8UJ17_9GAMM|nr:TonB-dependent receptor [Acidihalobacter ferrooxydans]APZ43836.1 hypothetical protein BW247_12660 [Acidihalobacter ferrooxydans]